MGSISGLSLCVKREVVQTKCPHKFMDYVEWRGWLVKGLEETML